MNAPDFLDANVLVYAYDPTNSTKQTQARDLLRKALRGGAVFSAQVLAEFAATLLHKLSPHAKPEEVRLVLDALAPIRVIPQDEAIVRRAVEAHATPWAAFLGRNDCGGRRAWRVSSNPLGGFQPKPNLFRRDCREPVRALTGARCRRIASDCAAPGRSRGLSIEIAIIYKQ